MKNAKVKITIQNSKIGMRQSMGEIPRVSLRATPTLRRGSAAISSGLLRRYAPRNDTFYRLPPFIDWLPKILILVCCFTFLIFNFPCFVQGAQEPSAAGTFYPEDSQQLSAMIEGFFETAKPQSPRGEVFALIEPHAGYGFSGQTAAYGYKLIKNNPVYQTVVIIGTSHTAPLNGVSVYPKGVFRTPLGDVEIDNEFASKLLGKDSDIIFEPSCFLKEHSVEVQLPFLQKALADFNPEAPPSSEFGVKPSNSSISVKSRFKIVPVIVGDCSLLTCKSFASLLKQAIGQRQDVLVVVSTDMAHRYDYKEVEVMDALTLSYLKNMDADGLYYGLRDHKIELCGGFGTVSVIILAKELGHDKLEVLKYTNSAEVTGRKDKGTWTVGYVSCVIDQIEGEKMILNSARKKKLLEIARKSIEAYLKSGKKIEITENDPVLLEEMGAFVTLREHGQLRGCIGNIIGKGPLYLTVRDMAVEAAVGDPRFSPLDISELKGIEIEVSVLSPLEKIDSMDKLELGKHGVLIKKGSRSGVFLPQVAAETGWSKQEFLENLCVQKAGLSADAWKDKTAEIYIFSAEVFSEKEIK